MKPEEYRLVMRNLEAHYQDFMRDSQDSQLFSPDDRMRVEDDYSKVSQHFDNLLRSMEKGKTSFAFRETTQSVDFMQHFYSEKKKNPNKIVNSPFREISGC